MSCGELRGEIPCTKRAAEAERRSESRKNRVHHRNEAPRWLDKSCGDGRVVIASLRGRVHPGGKEGARPGSKPTVFSNRPNRGWDGKHRNGGRKTRRSGRQGKPSARRGTPSALPADSQCRGDLEFHAFAGVRPDTHDPTGWICCSKGCPDGVCPRTDTGGVS